MLRKAAEPHLKDAGIYRKPVVGQAVLYYKPLSGWSPYSLAWWAVIGGVKVGHVGG